MGCTCNHKLEEKYCESESSQNNNFSIVCFAKTAQEIFLFTSSLSSLLLLVLPLKPKDLHRWLDTVQLNDLEPRFLVIFHTIAREWKGVTSIVVAVAVAVWLVGDQHGSSACFAQRRWNNTQNAMRCVCLVRWHDDWIDRGWHPGHGISEKRGRK